MILIDNGHGENTPGKRSPNGFLREYLWAREIAHEVERELRRRGYECVRIVKGMMDTPLQERVNIVNDYCKEYGAKNVVLVSIHVNAAGNGQWMNARGWSAYTSKGKTKSDDLANMLYEEAEKNFTGQKIRKDYQDGDADWEENFYLLKHTKCPAVLTENFFMDNKEDMEYITSIEGREAVIKTHVEALVKYANKYL